ncbi:MAG TPA: GNAT family N-acetyltransferase [Tahibacter sp.]|nr:GNAT family N-acetyltransferase [Tahibacter sp.]
MTDYAIESARADDAPALLALYRAVAAIEGGLARSADEITPGYIEGFLGEALAHGYSLVARLPDGTLAGEIHTYPMGPKKFAHVLGELTIAVHPAHQGAGVGRALFRRLIDIVAHERPDILRVELAAQESNARAIRFYESLGFVVEGRMTSRIASVGGGSEADIPMAWLRPAR